MNALIRKTVPAVLLAAALAALGSCATTEQVARGDVDVTPTARLRPDAHVGKALAADSTSIQNISDSFAVNDPVYLVVDLPGDQGGTLRARWMYGSEQIHEQFAPIVAGKRNYAFVLDATHTQRAGDYQVEVYVNDDMADSEKFSVKTP